MFLAASTIRNGLVTSPKTGSESANSAAFRNAEVISGFGRMPVSAIIFSCAVNRAVSLARSSSTRSAGMSA